MKNQIFAIALLSIAAFTLGCKEQTTAQKLDKLKADTQEAAQDLKDYSFGEKAQFIKKMEDQLAELNRDLNQLSAKIETSSDTAKAEAKPRINALREQMNTLTKQLDEARNADESAWDSVKASSRKAYEGLKDGVHQTRQWVSEKIAP